MKQKKIQPDTLYCEFCSKIIEIINNTRTYIIYGKYFIWNSLTGLISFIEQNAFIDIIFYFLAKQNGGFGLWNG